VAATNAASVTVTGNDGSNYTLPPAGGTQAVTPTATTIYTATATATGTTGSATASTTVTVTAPGSIDSINHVIFMMQENRTFDSYFGMLNPYRDSQCTNAQGQQGPCATVGGQPWDVGDDGVTYTVDGIDDKLTTLSNADKEGDVYHPFKLTTTCIDDDSSAWQSSYGDVSEGDYKTNRPIPMNGFVHVAEGFATSCANGGTGCSGKFTDLTGQRAMGYYDQGFLNYYYYMASQFAVSDRWFSPISTYTINNRIATFTGGTTQGLVRDPENTDHLSQLQIKTIFEELTKAGVSWKIYYTVTDGNCLDEDDCPAGKSAYPATDFSDFGYSLTYLRGMPANGVCPAPMQPSGVVGDTKNTFCIDPTHIAPLSDANYGYFADLQNGTLPSFAFIEPGYSVNDEHPSSGGNILAGQVEVAKIINALMDSSSWKDSVFFLSYDEGGGPYDHVPPVPGHSNDFTDASQVANYPELSSTAGTVGGIAVNPESNPSYWPCLPADPATPTLHCDLPNSGVPGANPDDAPAQQGFAAQIGFRMPNMVISPFTRRHYVSHIPMDHTAIIKFVENRFIGPNEHLTARDAAQPTLLDFFDFNNVPWATPPTPPTPDPANQSPSVCHPDSMGP
jgi:phospholipase C